MKISIITAAWNSAETIRDTLESVLSQSYPNYEHIIIDGASKDNTLEIVEQYKPLYNGRLRVISESDKGIYDAMNKGILMATGDIVGILNSDDVFFNENVLSHVIDGFISSNTDSVYGGAEAVDWRDISKVIRIKRGSPMPRGGFSTGWHPSHPTFFVKKSCYDKYGLFDLSFGTASDMELMIRFLERYQISSAYIPKILIKMRFGGASNGSLRAILRSNSQVLRAFKHNGLKKPHFYIVKKLLPKFSNLIALKLGLVSVTSEHDRMR